MPGSQIQFPSRTSVITDAWANLSTQKEKDTAFQGVIAALRGAWGTGPWDGGFPDAQGHWEKHSYYWDAKLSMTSTGDTQVVFPFKVTDSLVKVYQIDDQGAVFLSAYYIASATAFSFDFAGKVIIELQNVKVVK